MRYYAAPMEGITGYIYRRAHRDFYPGADRYYTPFIAPGQKNLLRSREARDVLPENNAGLPVVPQILTNNAQDFITTAEALHDLGYQELNLNLGCPSGTVTAKHRGSGFLSLRDELDGFFETVFSAVNVKISVKTRIGSDSPEEIVPLMEIFNRYPICELTIHPRVRTQKYGGKPDMDAFRYAVSVSTNPVCYNGDLFTPEDIRVLSQAFPQVGAVMLGRGLISDPSLIERTAEGGAPDKERLRRFHDRLLSDYEALGLGDRNVLFRMKELWFYMSHMFHDSGKYLKAINKSQKVSGYVQAVDALFRNEELNTDSDFSGE